MMLLIFHKGAELIELGVPVQELSQLPLLAEARRAKQRYSSTQVEQIRELNETFIQTFERIRMEYARFKEQAE